MTEGYVYLEPAKFLKLCEGVDFGCNWWLKNLCSAARLLVEIGYTQMMPVPVGTMGELADLRAEARTCCRS